MHMPQFLKCQLTCFLPFKPVNKNNVAERPRDDESAILRGGLL